MSEKVAINIGAFILDDDVEMHDIMMDTLRENNLTAEITDDPAIFISKLKASDINICVLDHVLTGKDTGLDMIKQVKAINKWSIVIIMSGQSEKEIAIKYLNSGANKYIDKNWNVEELKDILKNCPLKKEFPSYLDVLVKYMKEGIEEAKERVQIVRFLETIKDRKKNERGYINIDRKQSDDVGSASGGSMGHY